MKSRYKPCPKCGRLPRGQQVSWRPNIAWRVLCFTSACARPQTEKCLTLALARKAWNSGEFDQVTAKQEQADRAARREEMMGELRAEIEAEIEAGTW